MFEVQEYGKHECGEEKVIVFCETDGEDQDPE
jgi:hypothetical protein